MSDKRESDEAASHFQMQHSLAVSPVYFRNTASHENRQVLVWKNPTRAADQPLAFPPHHLMQYQENVESHTNSGKRLADMIRSCLIENGIRPKEFQRALEFGCSNSRVLRHFQDLAEQDGREYWGCDINSNTILWNAENLTPPFHYFVNTTMPHLPFVDHYFDFVFATSVFTHIDDLFVSWNLEMRRLVSKTGYAFFTYLDENSVRFGLEKPHTPVGKKIAANRELIDGLMEGRNNMVSLSRGHQSFTFVRREFLQDRLSAMWDVVGVLENTMAGHQTGLLLKNKSD